MGQPSQLGLREAAQIDIDVGGDGLRGDLRRQLGDLRLTARWEKKRV